jgi:hypothetical protein
MRADSASIERVASERGESIVGFSGTARSGGSRGRAER